MYSYWLVCIKLKCAEYIFSYTILKYELYRDPGKKGNVIADSDITTTPTAAVIFTRCCYSQCIIDLPQLIENLLEKMYIENALMSKSGNIALSIRLVGGCSISALTHKLVLTKGTALGKPPIRFMQRKIFQVRFLSNEELKKGVPSWGIFTFHFQ